LDILVSQIPADFAVLRQREPESQNGRDKQNRTN
jgi:hypothetical protein